MCDTLVVVENSRVLFAKNSDRDANEGQNLVWEPRRGRGQAARLRCTYIEIPEVDETYATLLSRPFWMWGAEIGTNECGVTIGNEAVFTREPYEKEPGLLGMDLLRLALERAATADEAVTTITDLLERYGQGGGCGHESKKFTYHNSFLVADPSRAYVVETAGRHWDTERVQGVRSISNGLTIPGFRDRYSDFIRTRVSACRARQARTTALGQGVSVLGELIGILQDHGAGDGHPQYAWANGALSAPCVHAGGVLTSTQTTASWVAELSAQGCAHWATGTAAPCVSLFKPVAVDTPVPLAFAKDTADDSPWWRHEAFHRRVLRNPERLRPLFEEELRATQQRWLSERPDSADAFAEADALVQRWTDSVAKVACPDLRPLWSRRYWEKRNRMAGLRLDPAVSAA